jgi:hypothetical protein
MLFRVLECGMWTVGWDSICRIVRVLCFWRVAGTQLGLEFGVVVERVVFLSVFVALESSWRVCVLLGAGVCCRCLSSSLGF